MSPPAGTSEVPSHGGTAVAAARPARLSMKPATAARGQVDGGWWPRSRDPTVEFPSLVTALNPRIGPISRVSYHLDVWPTVPRKLIVAGHVVRLDGFHTIDPHTVTVTGTNSRRVSLLVVPPNTPDRKARAVLRAAAEHDSTATTETILTDNGVLPDPHPATGEDKPRAKAATSTGTTSTTRRRRGRRSS